VQAAGSTADGLHTASDDSEDFAPDFDWDATVVHDDKGWTALYRLPFASLRYAEGGAEGAPQTWRIMVARRLPRQQFHLLVSTPIPRDAPSFIATLQPLAGVALPPDHAFLTVRPSLTLRRTAERGTRSDKAEASLDVKWRPRAELVLDATLRPDFSQVELDVPQLAGNSRFALFLTEKRPFFFESADLLRSPTDAFYTRSFTQPRWGLRSTWRGAGWAGTAMALDDRGGGLVLLPGAYGTDFAEQPGSKALAARVRSDSGSMQVGGVLAARRYEQDSGENHVLGPDFGWAFGDGWRLKGQWLHSRTSALGNLPGSAGKLARGSATDGDRMYFNLRRDTGLGELAFSIDDVSSDFRHDTGFVNQAGVRKLGGFVSKGWLNVGPFNSFFVNTDVFDVRERRTGELVQQIVRPGLYFNGARSLEAWVEWYARSALRTAPGAPLLRENFGHFGLVMSPAPWFPLVDGYVEVGEFGDTTANVVRPGARGVLKAKLRPLAPLEVEPTFNFASLREGGVRVFREVSQSWLAVWHFDARHSLRLIAQRSLLDRVAEPGVDAFADGRRTTSATYAWRYSAGTRVFVGATWSRNGRGEGNGIRRANEAFIKVQVDADEVRRWW
jgi:hypothetical protein